MKNNQLLLLVILFSATIISCKKNRPAGPDAPFSPVSFTTTEYGYLGTYDTLGRPLNYLLVPDTLSQELTSFIQNSLPAGEDISKTNPTLLSSNSDLNINKKSDVFITFVSEGASQLNSLGFYIYPTNTPPKKPTDIKKILLMFPNASLAGWAGGGLNPGDKIKIGTVEAGNSVGFVLLEKGWNKETKTVNSKGNHFCSNEILNPENDPGLKKHTVLLNYPKENKIFIGFEDMMRTEPSCDHDFNDIIIYATIKAL